MDDQNFAALDAVLSRVRRRTLEEMEDEDDPLDFTHVRADELDLEDMPADADELPLSQPGNGWVDLESDEEL